MLLATTVEMLSKAASSLLLLATTVEMLLAATVEMLSKAAIEFSDRRPPHFHW